MCSRSPGGTYEAAAMFAEGKPQRESTRRREAFFIDYAERVRRSLGDGELVLMVTGGFRSAAGMNDALQSGAVDIIGMARPLAAEPDLPARLIAGRATAAHKIELATSIKHLDSLIQGAWYQVQLTRMARGQAPSPSLGRFSAVIRYLLPRRKTTAAAVHAATATTISQQPQTV